MNTSSEQDDSPYQQAVTAMHKGMSNLEQAAMNVRGKYTPRVPDEAEYVRYRKVVENPTELFKFVSRGLGTRDPDKIHEGAKEYLTEMRKRFGE